MSLKERWNKLIYKGKHRPAEVSPSTPEANPNGITRRTIDKLAFAATALAGSWGVTGWIIDSQPMPFNPRNPESNMSVEEIDLPDDYEKTLVLPPTNLAAGTNRTGFCRFDDGRDMITCTFTVEGNLQTSDDKNSLTLKPDSAALINNIVIVVNRNTRKATITAGPITEKGTTAWISPQDDEERSLRKQQTGTFYRPLSPFTDNGQVYAFLERNQLKDPLWEYYGTDLAILDMSTDSPTLQESIISLPRPDKESKVKTSWGTAITEDDHYIYIYGSSTTTSDDPQQFNTREIRLARVEKGSITDISQWQFLGKNGWVGAKPDALFNKDGAFRLAEQQAIPIVAGDQNIAATFSANRIGDNTVIVSKRADIFNDGNAVDAYIAKTPSGPFKKITLMDKLPDFSNTIHAPQTGKPQVNSVFFYPEAFNSASPNEILLMFSIGPSRNLLDEVENNVATYADVQLVVDMQEVLARELEKV